MKKRFLSIFLALCIILTAFPIYALATESDEIIVSGDKWKIDSTGTLTISFIGEMKNYDHPSGTYSAPWYNYRNSIKSIVFESSVTSIGNYAFYACNGLRTIILPDNIRSIGDYAFSECDNLASFTIPASVTSIGFEVFRGCNNLTDIIVNSENPHYTSEEGVLFNKD